MITIDLVVYVVIIAGVFAAFGYCVGRYRRGE